MLTLASSADGDLLIGGKFTTFENLKLHHLASVHTGIPTVRFSTAKQTVQESDGSAGLVVQRTGNDRQSVEIDYETLSATAVAGKKFTAQSGHLQFARGETAKLVPMPT